MSEIVEMILAGELCEECAGYIGDEVGYPRKCNNCKPKAKRAKKKKKNTKKRVM